MFLRRIILYHLFLLTLAIGNAFAGEREPFSEPAGLEPGNRFAHSDTALKEVDLNSIRARGVDLQPVIRWNRSLTHAPASAVEANRDRDFLQLKEELENIRLKDEDLGLINGGATPLLLPDVRNQRSSAIILWDEVKAKHNLSVDQGYGQVTATISIQGGEFSNFRSK